MTDSRNFFEDLVLPPRPQEPLPGECCGRGCERCVYVYYEEALLRWGEKVERLKEKYQSENETPVPDGGVY